MTRRNHVFVVLAFGFVLLAVGLTATGVAWPSIAEDFDRSLAELGYITLLFGGGYTASTLLTGRLVAKTGIGRLLLAAAAVATVALLALAASDAWVLFLATSALLGVAGGLTDAVTNTYVAIRRGARAMGFLHGAFGVGAIAGPLLVAGLLQAGLSWRAAFATLAAAELVYVAGLWLVARDIDVDRGDRSESRPKGLFRSPILLWSLAVFFAYGGIAAGVGVWAFTFLTEERGISEGYGGLVVAAYWGGLTLARLLLGLVGNRVEPNTVLRWTGVATVAGLAVFWWNPTTGIGIAALIFVGFAHGPIFPLEILLTPRRFGTAVTATVVGFELAVFNIGAAVIPGVIGLFVDRVGLVAIPPLVFLIGVLLWAAIEMLRVASRHTLAKAR